MEKFIYLAVDSSGKREEISKRYMIEKKYSPSTMKSNEGSRLEELVLERHWSSWKFRGKCERQFD